MTKPTMALAELAEKGPDADLLREMIQYVAQRMMEMDVEGRCGATFAERSLGQRGRCRAAQAARPGSRGA